MGQLSTGRLKLVFEDLIDPRQGGNAMSSDRNIPENLSGIPGNMPQPINPSLLEQLNKLPDSNFIPQGGMAPLPGLFDFESWADERINIFASLDAAMTRHIMEAVSALSELRRRAEEDARRIARQLEDERVVLQNELNTLKLEKMRVQEEFRVARQELEEERARKYALEKEVALLQGDGIPGAPGLAHEVANLTRMVLEMSHQLQNISSGSPAISYVPVSALSPEPNPITMPEFEAVPVAPPEPRKPEVEQMMNMSLQEFSDAPTPRLRSNRSHRNNRTNTHTAPAIQAAQEPTTGSTYMQAPLYAQPEPDMPVFEPEPPSSPASRPFEAEVQQNIEDIFASTDSNQRFDFSGLNVAAALEMEEEQFIGMLDEISPVPPPARSRQAQEADQRLTHLLTRRISPADFEKAATLHAADAGELRRQAEQYLAEKADNEKKPMKKEKAALMDLGAKLGLVGEVRTPPPGNEIVFAPDFAPPPELVFEEKMEDSLLPSLDQIFHDNDSAPPSFIQDDESSPRIGEIGSDEAHQWGGPSRKEEPTAPRARAGEQSPIPPYRFSPPPAGVDASDIVAPDDFETKVTISNLQGLSLLMMEKVVRGLPGVRHVTVTDFRKGELVMEVRHHASLDLGRVLPELPDLNLKLVSRDDGLMFAQER
jgi:hypothetical protein